VRVGLRFQSGFKILRQLNGQGHGPDSFLASFRELLENEFLYRSPSADVFFVNIMYMFNGNRITLAKSYYLKEAGIQGELPFEGPKEQTKLSSNRGSSAA